jgi:hypothetical protein
LQVALRWPPDMPLQPVRRYGFGTPEPAAQLSG